MDRPEVPSGGVVLFRGELALQQISQLREILELSQKARAYLMTASADLILQLYNGENWGAHPELAYIYKMRELF